MTELTRIKLKLSEVRSKLAAEDISDDDQSQLLKQYAKLEEEHRELLKAHDHGVEDTDNENEVTDESELIEYRSLVSQSQVSRYFDSVVNHVPLDGAELELQRHHGLNANQIPLDVLRGVELETRAVTPSPTNTGVDQQPIEPAVFPNMQAGFLRIPMPRVPVGDVLYPDLTTLATVKGPLTDSTSVSETTGSFSTVSISPARFQASFFYRRSDAARFAGMSEALRMNLNDALANELDKYIITQLTGSSTIDDATDPTKALTYAESLDQFIYSRVDGQWVSMPMDLAHVVNTATYAQLSTLYQNTARDNALEQIMARTAGIRVSKHVAAASSNISTGIVRLGNRRDAVAPVWEGVTLINDEVTKAATGEIVITAVMLANFTLLRKGGFYLTKTYQA